MLMLMVLSLSLQLGGTVTVEGAVDAVSGDTISHSSSLLLLLEALLLHGNGSDVSLRVETPDAADVQIVPAHSLLLSLRSPVLRLMLHNHTGPAPLVLKENNDCAAVFHKFIRYLYCGEISLSLEQATPLHKLATKYQVAVLQEGVTQYMIQNLATDSPSGHVSSWYEYALWSGDGTLRDACLQYLAWNLSSVLHSAEWPGVSAGLLLTLLQRSDLVLDSEEELFHALEAWILHNQPDGLTAENTLRSVRYAMMSPQELFRLQTGSAVLTRYQESVRDLLYMSYQFHSASPLHMAKYFDVNCSLFVPRNYLSPAWASPWVIPNPIRDDRSTSFQTQLGPSGHDAGKRITWNALFSPRWLPVSMRPVYAETGAIQPARVEGGWPRIIITPATSSADFAGVTFQKTVLVMAQRRGKVVVTHVYDFHQSTEENEDFLRDANLHQRSSQDLMDGSLYLHIVVKPLYQSLTKN